MTTLRGGKMPETERGWMPLKGKKILLTIVFAAVGLVIGGYISAELLYVHHPSTARSWTHVWNHTFDAVIYFPISMTIGLVINFTVFGLWHGLIALVGVMAAMAGAYYFHTTSKVRYGLLLAAGVALWAHNNYLAFSALMSV